jgi:hypothetical protein
MCGAGEIFNAEDAEEERIENLKSKIPELFFQFQLFPLRPSASSAFNLPSNQIFARYPIFWKEIYFSQQHNAPLRASEPKIAGFAQRSAICID